MRCHSTSIRKGAVVIMPHFFNSLKKNYTSSVYAQACICTWLLFHCELIGELMNKRPFAFLGLQKKKPRQVPRASEVNMEQHKEGEKLEFRLVAMPHIVKCLLGSPPFIISFDLETHDYVKRRPWEKKGHRGRFGWYTMDPPEDLQYQRIVELGWTLGTSTATDEEVIVKVRLVQPDGFVISERGYEFHEISNAEANAGASLSSVLKEFMDDVKTACAKGGRICAHNLEFDAGIIFEELGRCDLPELQHEWAKIAKWKSYCTMNPTAGRWIREGFGLDVGSTTKQHTWGLQRLRETTTGFFIPALPIGIGNPHRAGADALVCRRVYTALLYHGGSLVTDDDVHNQFQIGTGPNTSAVGMYGREGFDDDENAQNYDPGDADDLLKDNAET